MEAERLRALHAYDILDTEREASFDDITRLASLACGTPISAINLIDAGRQWFKSEIGLGVRETPIETSICALAILESDVVVVNDLQADRRFADNPLVTEDPGLRFYAGAILETTDGFAIGTVCVLDYVIRELTEEQKETLRGLARQVMIQLEFRRALRQSRETNDALEKATLALEYANRSKDELLGMISHELRSPLTTILGNADVLQGGMLLSDHQRQQALKDISSSSRQLEHLVANMLVLSRQGTEAESEVELEPMLLQRLLPELIEQHQCHHPDPLVTLNIDERLPAVLGQPGYLGQLMSNLLGNAVKYADHSFPVQVAATADPEEVTITVADRGAELDAAVIDKLFEAFYRSAETKQRANGVGLGLAVCQRLVRATGGRIWAAPRLGGGLEVSFTLPIALG